MKNLGARILLSLLIGGVLQEVLIIATAKEISSVFVIAAIGSFILISVFTYLRRTIKMQRKVDNQLKQNAEIIDQL
jgi:hypothetical protein